MEFLMMRYGLTDWGLTAFSAQKISQG